MEPSQAIMIIETDLRRLVRAALPDGDGWLTGTLGEQALNELRERQAEEARRRSPAVVPTDLLQYTHLYQLRRLVDKHWEVFVGPLGKKKEVDVLLDLVEDFRNAPAHSRELLPHERQLLEGIAGLVRTRVTKFVSSTSSDAKHYPVIERISDSFGNTCAGSKEITDTGLTLQVGDVVTFDCRGWDAQGRELTWYWGVGSALDSPTRVSGTDVQIKWEVKPEHVAAAVYFEINLASSGSYHRHSFYDDQASFRYTVEPPGL